jgi:osmotically-inducible protein OsmY
MRSDQSIQQDIEEELCWAPDVNHSDIVVKVAGGIVTLSGYAPSLRDRLEAESAAMRVHGVRGIANDIVVRVPEEDVRHDSQIACDAAQAIEADQPALAGLVKVIVTDGRITLEGSVPWQWQRQRIESVVRDIAGVVLVNNLIAIQPHAVAEDIKRRIEDAFRRSAQVDARQLTVEAHEDEVILRGAVRSLHEKEEAQRTAWRAPGVSRVVNEITISP